MRTRSDTEVLLALYVRDGAACLDRLHGIFAFAIWDSVEKRLFLARDHLGVKPLYYAVLDQGFLFASELKALTLCRDLPRDIDPVVLADHLGFLWTAGEATILQAVSKLRPGCTLTVDAAGARVQRYYRTPLPNSKNPGSAADLRDLIDRVIAEQMVADVEVGALLSGGLDSSAIVAAMCRAADPGKIMTFCAAILDLFADPAWAARMGAAARSFVEQTWTWETHFLRLEAEMFGALDGSERSMPVSAPPGDSGMPAVDKSNRGHNSIYLKAPMT